MRHRSRCQGHYSMFGYTFQLREQSDNEDHPAFIIEGSVVDWALSLAVLAVQ